MFSLISLALLILNYSNLCNGATNCPLYGPVYPKSEEFPSSSSLQDAVQSLTSTFDDWDTNATIGGKNSYSVQVFSASSSTLLFEHHHTADNLASVKSAGVSEVDADTVYRIGSISKIFTIYTFLVEAGDKYLSHSITEFVPELAALVQSGSRSAITKVAWGDITVGELASHMAGIASDSN
jgi:CubicO group peptidase (beta-lactamase class C family)